MGPEVLHISRSPFFTRSDNGDWKLAGGGVQTSMAQATEGLPDAMVAVLNNGGSHNSWEQNTIIKSGVPFFSETAPNYDLHEFHLGNKEYEMYRRTSIIWWWIHHNMPLEMRTDMKGLGLDESFLPDYTQYRRVSTQTSHEVAGMEGLLQSPIVMLHDPYYFSRVAKILKGPLQYSGNLVAINHIPFPAPENFTQLQMLGLSEQQFFKLAKNYIAGWLDADTISFHTQQDADNFSACVQAFGLGDRNMPDLLVNPLGVDINNATETVSRMSGEDENKVLSKIIEHAPNLTSIDDLRNMNIAANIGTRADPIKKIPQTLEAVKLFLEQHPEQIERFTYVQQILPHRGEYPSYAKEFDRIKQEVQRVNGLFGKVGYQPIILIPEGMNHPEVLQTYNVLARLAGESGKFFTTALGHEGMNISVQEGFLAGRHSKSDTTMLVSAQTGMGQTLKDRGISGSFTDGNNAHQIADAIQEILNRSKEELNQTGNSIYELLKEIQLKNWTNRLLHHATNGTIGA